MPGFRAIKQPSESPVKPSAGERQLADTMSRPKCDLGHARPAVVVPLLDAHRSVFEEAVAKAKKALPRKKLGSSTSSTSKPRRQQAPREKKLMYSIEESPGKPTGSPTPECGNDDSDFVPSKADLVSISSVSNTPPRRSPRKHSGKCPNTGSLPLDGSAPVIIKQKELPTVAAAISAKPSSPSLWSSPVRQKLYEQDEFVELPGPVFEYEQGKKQLRIKKETMIAEKRKEKGKAVDQRSIEETCGSRQKSDKRKAQSQMEQNKPRKRRKSKKLRPEELAHDGRFPSEVPQPSKQRSSRWSSEGRTTDGQMRRYRPVSVKAEDRSDTPDPPSKMGIEARSESSKNKEVQPSSQASAKAQHFPVHDAQLDKPGEQPSRNKGRKKRRPKQDCRESFKRREVSVPESFRRCSCTELPEYFTRDPSYVPRLRDWPVGRLIFFEHVKQISTCRGSIHPAHVVRACRKILEESNYPEQFPFGSGRAQSSIPPPVFYGKRSGCQPDASTGNSVRQPQQNGNTGCLPSKTLPVRNRGETARAHGAPSVGQSSKYIIPSNSSPLGQRRKAGVPSHPCECNDSPSGQENVGARQPSKILPEDSSVVDRPERSFGAQRRRHQSVPVNAFSRNTHVDERIYSGAPAPQRHNNALHEISNNVVFQRRIEQRLEAIEKAIQGCRPATAPTQIAAAEPVAAPAPRTAAAAQGVDGAEQAPASRKRKRPSHAERQLKNPKLSRNVPQHLIHTDAEIIEIGKIVNAYKRHAAAPEAFDWTGRLYSNYKRLMAVDGVLVWTVDEIKRLMK